MDHQWRPRPMQGNVCPTCSVSHFPFCPPPLQYHQPSRFPFEGDYSFQRPGIPFNPYTGPVATHGPYVANRNDGFADPTLWPRNPNWQMPQQYPPREGFRSPIYDHGTPNGYVGEGDRNFKRPRVDDPGSDAAFTNYHDKNPARNLSEDERRLKLIRDHGVALSKPPEEQGFGEPGKINQNGFRSDVNQGAFSRDEKDVFPHSQVGGFMPSQYGQPLASPQMSQRQANDTTVANKPGYSQRDGWQQTGNGDPNKIMPQSYGTQHHVQVRHDFHSSAQSSNVALPAQEFNFPSQEGNQTQVGRRDISGVSQRSMSNLNGRGVYGPYSYPTGGSNFSEHMGSMEASRIFNGQPPLPSSPPPPLPLDPHMNHSSELAYYSPPKAPASLFPVSVSSSAVAPSSYPKITEAHSMPQPYFKNKPQSSTGFPWEDPSKQFLGDAQRFSQKQLSADKPKFIDASHLFRNPHRTTRPDHIAIILRGLPGSGKSYLAKMFRDLEVENGGDAPRIHSMDDYFMTEVEKVDDNDASKSSSSGRGKKPVMKKVMEYCYEPEMEEAYRSSMLKAFKKNVEEGVFTFIIVDDRNLRVADFAQFWATAKRSGYEVYILEASYKDPAGCAARNVHGFTQEDIEKMARQWEEAPSLYLQLDVKSLFHGDDLRESRILEVDMDMEDDIGDALPVVQEREDEKIVESRSREDASDASLLEGKRWDDEGDHPTEEVRVLGKSKWSEDFDDDENDHTESRKGNSSALSGLIHAYGKEGKSVHWGDQGGNTGFSIGAAKKANTLSLVIGPGAGYNLKSNPLPEEETPTTRYNVEPKKHSIFQERLRAERESFKAVFDRRRQRIGGLDADED
ncbi:pollen-specific leucine-rich repeat extensin-like protein 1 isoform X1 [Senna tora]|uniref:Pollen-specific leucine-rich repeat extensin-like protein 1 isoform X1 n=1 Tax=Senna tora TaxID=362788 RepID=A0A834X6P5_9FABA|nr:pollen-specific leucine-rich repeat extensin-like protein 1 isoform X1 [Senna tora]